MKRFWQKLKQKRGSLLASFFAITILATFCLWFWDNFLKERDSFLNFVPSDTAIYYHSNKDNGNSRWFKQKINDILKDNTKNEAEYLFENIVLEEKEFALAILSGFSNFVFYIKENNGNDLNKLDEDIYEKKIIGENIIISNSEAVIQKIIEEQGGLFGNLYLKMAYNKRVKDFSKQLFVKNNLKAGILNLSIKDSRVTDNNYLVIRQKEGDKEGIYDYLLASEGDYLKNSVENTMKDYLSVLFPEKKARKLQDGTAITEIIANPDLFNFKDQGDSIKYLNIKELEREVWLGKSSNGLFLSTFAAKEGDFVATRSNPYGKSLFDFYFWLTEKDFFPNFDGIVLGLVVVD